MTPCQFNNLSSLCTAIFSEGRGRLYTRYNLSNSLKNTQQPNVHVNVQPKSRNRGEIFYYFGLDRSIISWEGVQVFSFADHSSLATSKSITNPPAAHFSLFDTVNTLTLLINNVELSILLHFLLVCPGACCHCSFHSILVSWL